jgi:hypothetical protein
MGKGGQSSNLPTQLTPEMQANETALTQIATESAQEGQQLYNLTEPGLARSEDYYTALSSGDPAAIMQAIAPGAQQVNAASQGAKKNILASPGGGGEKNLALEQVDVNKGAQIGEMAGGAYTGSFGALAKLGTSGVGESLQATGTGVSAYGAANSDATSIGNLSLEDAQVQMEQKGQSLWPVGALMSGGIKGSSAIGQAGGMSSIGAGGGGGGGTGGGYGVEGMDSSGGMTFGGDTGSDYGTMGGYDSMVAIAG